MGCRGTDVLPERARDHVLAGGARQWVARRWFAAGIDRHHRVQRAGGDDADRRLRPGLVAARRLSGQTPGCENAGVAKRLGGKTTGRESARVAIRLGGVFVPATFCMDGMLLVNTHANLTACGVWGYSQPRAGPLTVRSARRCSTVSHPSRDEAK